MGASRAAVAVAIVTAEREGTGAEGARRLAAEAGFAFEGTPYGEFITTYFS
jgi:hypothetical protein